MMFNGYYDLVSSSELRPYVGAGVGVAHNEMDGVTFATSPTRFR